MIMQSLKTGFLGLLLLPALCIGLPAAARTLASFRCAGATIVLLDSTEAATLNSRSDAYTRSHTAFDRAIRLNKAAGTTESDYLQAAARSVRSWPADEQAQLRRAFASIDSFARSSGIPLHFPDTVKMIKTSAAEEFGAEGYTRDNRIMLRTEAQPVSTHLLAHELWHVISRHDAKLRDRAYAAFQFKPCNNIDYKPALKNKVITNPDCPDLRHYVTIEQDGRAYDVALMLYSGKDYQPGYGMEQYARIGLLALTGDDAHKQPLLQDGAPVIFELTDAPDFMKKVGMNTPYLLHVEEITAEHFAALVTGKELPQMEFVESLKGALIQR